MSKLTARQRKQIPHSEFAGPDIKGKPSFPINDRSHAEAAIRLAPLSANKGHISKAQEMSIVAQAKRKLGRTGSKFSQSRDAQRAGH